MRTSIVAIAVLSLALFGCAKKADIEGARTAIQAADAAWSTAIGSKNTDEFMKFVATDATMMPPNGPALNGADAITAWTSQMMQMPGFSVSWQANATEVAAAGDMGYTLGAYTSQMGMPDGSTMSDHGKYATVWKKQADGSWKVVVDIFNSDVPMPMPAAADSTAMAH